MLDLLAVCVLLANAYRISNTLAYAVDFLYKYKSLGSNRRMTRYTNAQ